MSDVTDNVTTLFDSLWQEAEKAPKKQYVGLQHEIFPVFSCP